MTSRNEYNAFGEISTNGNSANSIGYTGQRLDNETGLMALGNGERYYSPQFARFIQQDSFKGNLNDPASLNRYSYAHNNPNKFVDPTGNVVESPWDAASLIVGLGSLGYNLYQGNYGDAAIDALGVVADTAALLLPGVPGGAGIGIKAYRVAKVTVKVLQTVDRAVNVGQGIANTYNNIQEGSYGWAAVTAGLTAFGAGGLRSSTRELNQAIKVSEEVAEHQKALQKAQDIFNAKNNPEALQEIVQDTAKAQKADLLDEIEAKDSSSSTLKFDDDPLIDNNILAQAQAGNKVATDFLEANRGLISHGKTTRNEFLAGGKSLNRTRKELSKIRKKYDVTFKDDIDYRDIIREGKELRSKFDGLPQNLKIKDSRQLAEAKLLGIDFVTNDQGAFKRALDLKNSGYLGKINIFYLDLYSVGGIPTKAGRKAANYIPIKLK